MNSPQAQPDEYHLSVRRTARYFVLGELSEDTREIWIGLHGYSQLAESFAQALAPVLADGRVVVAPEALNRFYLDEPAKRHGPDSPVGAGWMTREDRLNEIKDYVGYLDDVAAALRRSAPAAGITVLGFSQGVATACRWAALGATRVSRLILWGGALASDLPSDRGDRVFGGAAVVLVAGRKDSVVPVKFMQKERAVLAGHGISADLLEHDGGHSLNSEALRRLAS
jgi:predicted esterase